MATLASRALSYYLYSPSVAAAGALTAIYLIIFLVSLYQVFRYKMWIWFVMLLALLMETVGYGARIKSAQDVTARTVYIVQFCLIILAPVIMAGVIYLVFGRIVFHVVPAHARTTKLLWVPPRWITPIFVGFDILALLIQLIGAVIVAGTQATDSDAASKLQRGKDIALVGVTLQIVAFGLFSIIAARFHFTSRRFIDDFKKRFQSAPGDKYITVEGSGRKYRPQWRTLLYVVNISCVLILVRSAYREVEFGGGKNGASQTQEWYLYVFDTTPILLVAMAYTLFAPGRYVDMGLRQASNDQPQRLTSGYSGPNEYPMNDQPQHV